MSRQTSLDELWKSAPLTDRVFSSRQLSGLPEAARRYVEHAIVEGTPLASAVRLRMHGEIKLKRWCPFSAEQVISWKRGMIWNAVVRMHAMPIRGGDSFVDGHGAMRWKLFGIVPIINASGLDLDRSAAGRVNIESVWLPSVLCGDEVSWTESGTSSPHARFNAHSETAEIDFLVDEIGRLKSVSMPRWGNPNGSEFRCTNFGGFVEQERRFGGYTIPTRMRVGWYFGSERFESEGEFYRVMIDDAAYR
ncbi:MAG: hypothetical protein DMG49_27585 [Acidobacteria bacterium]|nr:MAG: hypothetical protein DMG49_27585 [Acidobacteriota bacterium]